MKIGVDLGGTNMRAGLVDGNRFVDKAIVPCPSGESEGTVLDSLEETISRIMVPGVTGIGIGVPSVVDASRGIVYNVMNIPSWKEVHLKEILERHFSLPVMVNNDANCFVLGEKHFGAGRPYGDVVGITLGTGVGCGLIIDGRLYNGANTGAGEICSLPYLDHDYEHYCSSGYFVSYHNTTGRDAAERALAGDPEALAVWNGFGKNIGKLMKAVMFAYDPEAVVIGGGIASSFALYRDAMWDEIFSFPYKETVRNIRIMPSEIEDVAMLGASALV